MGPQCLASRPLNFCFGHLHWKVFAMSYFVCITFDLKDAKTSDYPKVKAELEEIDFTKFVTGRKKQDRPLPSNTFVAEFDVNDFDKTSEVAEWVSSQFKAISKRLDLSGKCFISVGRNWAWKTSNF